MVGNWSEPSTNKVAGHLGRRSSGYGMIIMKGL